MRRFAWVLAVSFAVTSAAGAQPAADQKAPVDGKAVLADVIRRWADVIEPRAGQPATTFTTKVTVTKWQGLPPATAGASGEFAYQAPDRLRAKAKVRGTPYAVGRIGQQLWLHMPASKSAIVGTPDVPRFARFPDEKDQTVVPPFALPGGRLAWALAPMMVTSTLAPNRAEVNGARCEVLTIVPTVRTAALLGVDPAAEATLWVREGDRLPVRIAVKERSRGIDAQIDFAESALVDPLPDAKWAVEPAKDDKVERVAVGHLVRFMNVAPKLGENGTAILGPATGQRRVVAVEGKGRLEDVDGTRVLFLRGSPQEMGRQHGVLLRREIHDVCERILYGIGVGSSLPKGGWFFGEIERAQARLEPFIDPRHLAEMDALAAAAGVHVQEARLANFFPELFHCSGFAIMGKATKDGRMYHGRVLDYMKGVGLEQNAVVIVHQPDYGNAWVNLSYVGFVGSVTAMNEKGIAIGEMGGGGEGEWDGKPMAELMREVMERASTLDEAVAIMRKGPRTCQYYYVISDGKSKAAVGIAATPGLFEVVKPGQSHPLLPHAIPDAVLLSAGDRYEHLAKRVKDGYGTFDAQSAIKLMTRPVCMTSNIQSVLFAPDTLELWVANSDSVNVASHTRFTHYDLKQLLASDPTAAARGE
jgi:hypothetical protein